MQPPVQLPGLIGEWSTSILGDGEPIRIDLNILSTEKAIIVSVDQSNESAPVTVVPGSSHGSFKLLIDTASFQGRLVSGEIHGTWESGGVVQNNIVWQKKPAVARVATVSTSEPLIGIWSTLFRQGNLELTLNLEVPSLSEAYFTSIDQSDTPLCVSLLPSTDPHAVNFDVPAAEITYRGHWFGTDGDPHSYIVGTFAQGDITSCLVWTRGTAKVAPFTRSSIEELHSYSATPALAVGACTTEDAVTVFTAGKRVHGGTGAPVTCNDIWHIGSMTKAFTATLVARLVEQGIITWLTTVGEVLGDVVPMMLEAYKSITFLHLLSHRSGLQANLPAADFGRFTRHLPDARQERLTWARLALVTPPVGSGHLYSNSGYIVVGAMLEEKTGTKWEDLLLQHLCVPLGITSVGFGAPGTRDKVSGAVTHPIGHAPSDTGDVLKCYWPGAEFNDNPAVLGPAGRVHASLQDVLRFLRAHRDQPMTFLRPETWTTLHTPPFGGDYALGWVVRKNGNLWHNGSNTLWYSEMCIGANGRVAVAATNSTSTDSKRVVHKALRCALYGVEATNAPVVEVPHAKAPTTVTAAALESPAAQAPFLSDP